MGDQPAPGFGGDWLNGWLAAVGVTVLVQGSKLAWTTDPVPTARFVVPGDGDLATALADAIPTEDQLGRVPIAKVHPDSQFRLARKVDRATYRDRSRLARTRQDGVLEMCLSDIGRQDREGGVPHGPFDPPAPKGETLHDRVIRCRQLIASDAAAAIRATLRGNGARVNANGLGFDFRRAPSGVHSDVGKWVDPVVECLCFAGLSMFPVRGDRRHTMQRGWTVGESRRPSFSWPVWTPLLDRWAIDALLDLVHSNDQRRALLRRVGVSGVFGSVAQEAKSSLDSYRAYASERLW